MRINIFICRSGEFYNEFVAIPTTGSFPGWLLTIGTWVYWKSIDLLPTDKRIGMDAESVYHDLVEEGIAVL